MPRGPKWNNEENDFLSGLLNTYGEKPREWPEEVRQMAKAHLAARTESGIYQQVLKILKSRQETQPDPAITYTLTKGA